MSEQIQYIGARYVVKIYENSSDPSSAEWEANKNYEPLTMVTYNMGSYLSKKNVPASVGNPAQNKEYWAQTGFYNGQIMQLQENVANLQEDVGTLESNTSDLPTIRSNISELQEDVGTLETNTSDLPTIRSNITNLQANTERNLLVIGNSYVYYGVAQELEKRFDHYYEYRGSGTGFVSYLGHGDNFEDLLDNAISDETLDKTSITDILFVSAMGDTRAYTEDNSLYTSSLWTTLDHIQTKIAANFPNCKRKMITLAEIRSVPYFSDNPYSALFKIHRILANACYKTAGSGFEYLGWIGFNLLLEPNYTQEDNYHPNTNGANYLGNELVNAYFGNLQYIRKRTNKSVSFNYAEGGKITALVSILPDVVELELRATSSLSAGSTVTISQGDDLVDLTELDYPLPAKSGYPVSIWTPLVKTTDATQYEFFNLYIGGEDAHGIARVQLQSAPTQSTVQAGTLTMPNTNHVVYFM